MFHQVKVPTSDRDCLRFLWWKEGDVDREPSVFRMKVHLFGATSSPSCCNYAIKETAKIFGRSFEPCVQQTLTRDMYVDDCLTSVDSEERGKDLIENLTALSQKGGFHLTGWTSNNPEVSDSVPKCERAQNMEK